MELIIGKYAGYCYGVKKAIDTAIELSMEHKISTFGPLANNRIVTELLESKNINVISDLSEHDYNRKLLIRAHGIPKKIYEKMIECNVDFFDCTCLYVKKIHEIVQSQSENGKQLIIIGNKNHPEVIGIIGWSSTLPIIFNDVDELESYSFDNSINYFLVVQTTFSNNEFSNIVEKMDKLGLNIEMFDTICIATKLRQKEADEISKEVDIMVVLGDKNSSNSNKLYETCAVNCKKTYFVETINDLQLNIPSTNVKIGICAGASTPPAIIKEAINYMNNIDDIDEDELTFEQMLDQSFITLHTGDVVKGTVILVSNGEVSVNLGYKSDGLIARGEFSDDPEVDPNVILKPGDEIEVLVMRVNDGEGNVSLSKKRVDLQKGIEKIEEAAGTDKLFQGKIIDIVKGGYIALLNGLRVFVPASQISERYVEDPNVFKGQTLDFQILEVDTSKRRIIAGRKDLARKEADELKIKLFDTLKVGDRINGRVSRTVDFGAFVDIGGIDGLIHISELSWGRVKKVADVISPGVEVEVVVIDINKEKGRVSLSLKDTEKDPWKDAEERYAIGSEVGGKVARFAPFGAFVELEEGVDALIHISQISEKRIERPEDVLSLGQVVQAIVADVNVAEKKISISIRAINEPDIMDSILNRNSEPLDDQEIDNSDSSADSPMEETPVEDTPMEEAPMEDTPVEDTPVEETPVEDTPVEDTPMEETNTDIEN